MQILPDFSVRRAGATTATTAPARLARGVPGRRPRPARLPGVLLEFFSAKDREADFHAQIFRNVFASSLLKKQHYICNIFLNIAIVTLRFLCATSAENLRTFCRVVGLEAKVRLRESAEIATPPKGATVLESHENLE